MIPFPPKRILVPVDFSGPSLAAIVAVRKIAPKFRAAVDLVHIDNFHWDAAAYGPNAAPIFLGPDLDQLQALRRSQEKRLQKIASTFHSTKVNVRTGGGWPPARLAQLAQPHSYGLVIMGTHGYAGLDRFLFGSVSEALVRRARIPVLAVHQTRREFCLSKILVPCNMTAHADQALRYAIQISRFWKGSVEALYVAPDGERDAASVFRAHIERVVGRAAMHRVILRVRHGDPRDIILEQSRVGRFDLIILSAHRRPFSSDFVIGSTAERVLRYSKLPTLAVPSVGSRKHGGTVTLPPSTWLEKPHLIA